MLKDLINKILEDIGLESIVKVNEENNSDGIYKNHESIIDKSE